MVGGQYRLHEPLESGGFSTVWKATATAASTERPLAVKTPVDTTNDADAVAAAFDRERTFVERFRSALRPSAIASPIDHGTTPDGQYAVYEYLDGESLASALEDGRVSPGQPAIERFGVPLCHALAYLHLNGYLYLDLKPQNVLLLDGNTPVLIDFNTVLEQTDDATVFVEQDGYRPPEQTPSTEIEHSLSTRTDVFACGALLYCLVTGQSPPTESSALPLDPRQSSTYCPSAIGALIARATAPSPSDRPRDAPTLLRELIDCLGIQGYPAGLHDSQTDTVVPIAPSTSVGRNTARGPRPAVVVGDAAPVISPVHFRVVRSETGSRWHLIDESTNGTYVRSATGTEYALSEYGYERQANETATSVPATRPPSRVALTHGDSILPVATEYDREIVFHS